MKIGALVPARIGSKRLPKKNISMLGDKPLICWTIDTLLESNIFSDITVSTESEEISDIIRSFYHEHEVSILNRPAELAGDNSPLSAVKAHYLEERPDLEWWGLFMPTMPFRKIETLHAIQTAIFSGYPWAIKTCTSRTYPIMDYYYPVKNGVKRFFNEPCFYARMFDCTYTLERRDAHVALWQLQGLSHAERVFIVHADDTECLDIDTEEDFAMAQKVCSGKRMHPRPLAIDEKNGWRLVAPQGTDFDLFREYLGTRLEDSEMPLLLLDKARPPLSFLSLQDGCQRRPWINPKAAHYLQSSKLKQTGNMIYMPVHYLHDQAFRVQRNLGADNYRKLGKTDVWGGFHGLDGSTLPLDRVIFMDDIRRQPFYIHPFIWR
ncbi:MAG: hypothetical protein JRH18_15530 [Deltaproteobacteria bacterium]|nr:hypothetical protein [Deltaproteobacteria bacterium]MBW2153068.1 hypothetical protein [Deltaproteobacteria bacterium]